MRSRMNSSRKRWLVSGCFNRIEGILVQYLSHKDMEDISKYTLKALTSMLDFTKDEQLAVGL